MLKRMQQNLELVLDEAIHRLKFQDDIGNLNAELTKKEESTFAGLWVQHQPKYRVIVLFTQNGDVTLSPYIKNGILTDMIEVRKADVTFNQLEVARDRAVQIANELSLPSFSAINVIENQAELYVLDSIQFNTVLQKAGLQLPANVKVVKVNEMPKEVASIYGGLNLRTCTSGFSVRNSSGTKGVTTAAHCSNWQTYNGTNLPFKGSLSGAGYDIQWHSTPGFTDRNLVFDGTYNRYIYGSKFSANQWVGEWVCTHGWITNFGCGTIFLKNVYGRDIAVRGVTVAPGDSGGPWFWGNTAYGTSMSIVTFSDGGTGSLYAPVDQISDLGLTILTN